MVPTIGLRSIVFRRNKYKLDFKVTQTLLYLLVKHSFFFRYSETNIILCILKCEMPFEMHKIIYFFQKYINRKKMCAYPT